MIKKRLSATQGTIRNSINRWNHGIKKILFELNHEFGQAFG
jgi:hypothetical protein